MQDHEIRGGQDEERRVLIVDDEEDLALSFRDILEARGYLVETAHSVQRCRETITYFNAHVALLDIRLGRSNGIDLIPLLKQALPGIVCVMMTAYAATDTAIAALHEGAYDYLRKPLEPRDLFATLERCFEKLRLEREKTIAEAALSARNLELQEVNDRLRVIVESTRQLAAYSVNIRELGKRLLEEFAINMAAEGGSLFLVRDKGLELVHSLDYGHVPDWIDFPLRQGSVLETVINSGQPLLIKHIEQEAAFVESGWPGYKNGSILVFPIPSMSGVVVAIITLHNKTYPPFTEQDRDIGLILVSYSYEALRASQSAEQLQASEKRYKSLVENAPLGFLSIDAQGRVIDANPALVAILGSPSADAIRTNNMLTLPHLLDVGVSENLRRCLESGEPHISEFPSYTTAWGKQVYLRYYFTPIRNDAGMITGVQALIEDISERKRAEEALQESEAEYYSLFKNMLSGLAYHKILLDEHGEPLDYVFLEVNEAFCRLTGLSRDIIGKRATEAIPGLRDLEPDLISVYGKVALTGEEAIFESYFHLFGVWFSVSAYSPEKGYFISLLEDITERKWAEESLHKLNEELEERVKVRTTELQDANRALKASLKTLRTTQTQLVQSEKMAALGALVAGVAHEINTPVGVGVTAASYLGQATRDIESLYRGHDMTRSNLEHYLKTAAQSTSMILENLRRAAELIRSFKQVAVDQTREEKRRFNLKSCLDGVLLSLHPTLKKAQHTVTVFCPDELELDSDPGAFSQIITNFVMNSLDHGFAHDVHGKIMLEVIIEDGVLHLRYHDNGKGMNEQVRQRIFEPFYTTARGQGGSGLGLHIVYNLVTQRLNGRIECESAPEKGTTFLITIPHV